jgi:hypothetical protein
VNDQDLEAHLGRLRPAALPKDLAAQLAQAAPFARGKIRWLTFAAPLAAAAAWLLVSALDQPAPPSVPARLQPADLRVFAPVAERSVLVAERDLGVVEADAQRLVRLVHQTWIDDTTYRGDDGISTFRRTTPRAEIIPVVLEAF